MKIYLVAFGKLKAPGTRELTDYYLRNVKPFHEVIEIELSPIRMNLKSNSDRLLVRKKEAEILTDCFEKKTTRNSKIILLDEKGNSLPTLKIAEKMNDWLNTGVSEIFFCIGSAYGFSDELKKKASLLICFGAQTISHEIARVILAEQIYRVFSVIKNHPYHNEG